MTDPAPSPTPVVLHPAVAGDDPKQPASEAQSEGLARRARHYLGSLAGLWQRLPSVDDARKFVVNVTVIAAAALTLVVIVKTAVRPVTVIDAIGVPKELEERGYTSAVVAQRLIDEIMRIGAVAATLKDRAQFSSLPFENKIPKIDVAGLSLATFFAQLREFVGIVDTRISGEVTIERAPDATDKTSPPTLSLRLRIQDKGTVHVGEPAAKLDMLVRPAALQLVELFDPYVAAAYYYVNGDLDNAEKMGQRLLDSPKEEERRLGINMNGLIALVQNRNEEALAIFTGMMAAEPGALRPILNRAFVRITMGIAEATREAARPHFEYALTDALRAIALAEADGPVPTERQRRQLAIARTVAGEALMRMGDEKYDEAIAQFKRANAAEPKYPRAYFFQAQICRERKLYTEAVSLLAHAVDVDPNDPDIYDTYTNWGETLKDMGKLQQAQRIFERAIAADPKNSNGYASVGRIYLEQRDFVKAADFLRKAVDASPSWWWYHYHLAQALAGSGKYEPAAAEFQAAAKLEPLYALSYTGWGQALAQAARGKDEAAAASLKAEAAAKLETAGEIAPEDGAVLKEIGKGYVALGQPAEALDAYYAALQTGIELDDATLAEMAEMERLAARSTERAGQQSPTEP
jgi:tetratricopeptide (TPR) repeat protein